MKGLRVEIVVRREGAPVEEAIAQPVEDVATVLARAGHESGGPRTPRGGLFVDPGRSCDLGFRGRGRVRPKTSRIAP